MLTSVAGCQWFCCFSAASGHNRRAGVGLRLSTAFQVRCPSTAVMRARGTCRTARAPQVHVYVGSRVVSRSLYLGAGAIKRAARDVAVLKVHLCRDFGAALPGSCGYLR
jgi:hypothetical protein